MLLKLLLFSLAALANSEGKLVDVKKQDFSFLLEMPYATEKNITGKKWHTEPRCVLRTEAAEALIRAQKTFQVLGIRLKIQECYLPDLIGKALLVQKMKHGIGFDFETYFSRGGAVAVTAVDREGREFTFPGASYSGKKYKVSDSQAAKSAEANLAKLQWVMKKEGFETYPQVPWFFIYRGSKDWPFSNIPIPEIP